MGTRFIEIYNTTVDRKRRLDPNGPVEEFIDTNDPEIKWSHRVKQSLRGLESSRYDESHFRSALYRPFTRKYLYFDHFWNERRYLQYRIFPTADSEMENQLIWLKVGQEWPMFALMVNRIPEALPQGGSQCFPFYTYDEDGTNRRENITNWSLTVFRDNYQDVTIEKESIFHYVYGLLHHPAYRDRYRENLKRDLPHIPFAPDFWTFAKAGERLAEMHVGYEQQPEYRLNRIENPDEPLNWCVVQMKLSGDKTQIRYNDFLTLDGIPPKAFEYRLGNRSALEWVIDQYRVKTDRRSGIESDPNRADDKQYIVRLIERVITVSLETVAIVEGLPELGIPEN